MSNSKIAKTGTYGVNHLLYGRSYLQIILKGMCSAV